MEWCVLNAALHSLAVGNERTESSSRRDLRYKMNEKVESCWGFASEENVSPQNLSREQRDSKCKEKKNGSVEWFVDVEYILKAILGVCTHVSTF